MLKRSKIMLLVFAVLTIFALNTVLPTFAVAGWSRSIYAASPHYGTAKWSPTYIGELEVWVEGGNLKIGYYINSQTSECTFTETHVAVCRVSERIEVDRAAFLEDFCIPTTNSGNPKVGHFPYSMNHNPGVQSYTYTIPLNSIPGDAQGQYIVIAAHSVVSCGGMQETAWAGCSGPAYTFQNIADRNGGNWATVIIYPLS